MTLRRVRAGILLPGIIPPPPPPRPPGRGGIYVGTFAKTTDSAPATQSITGLPFKPKALLLWSTGQTTWNADADHHFWSVGVSAQAGGSVESYCTAAASQDNAGTANTAAHHSANAMTFVSYDAVVTAQATVAFDAKGFTLTWTTNDAVARVISYMAIGGSKVRAKVKLWNIGTSLGNLSVTGVGFQPDVILHFSTGLIVDSGTYTNPYAYYACIGSQPGDIFTIGGAQRDGETSPRGRGIMASGPLLLTPNQGLIPGRQYYVTAVSRDADGFTVNVVENLVPWPYRFVALCLKGVSHYGKAFDKRTGPGMQSITGAGFQPEGVLFIHGQQVSSLSPGSPARMGMGAADSYGNNTDQLFYDTNSDPTDTFSHTENSRCLYAMNGHGSSFGYAHLESLDVDGFTLHWEAGDANVYLTKAVCLKVA